jgi:hypothetical protein
MLSRPPPPLLAGVRTCRKAKRIEPRRYAIVKILVCASRKKTNAPRAVLGMFMREKENQYATRRHRRNVSSVKIQCEGQPWSRAATATRNVPRLPPPPPPHALVATSPSPQLTCNLATHVYRYAQCLMPPPSLRSFDR